MAKNRLSKNQQRRVEHNHRGKLNKDGVDSLDNFLDPQDGTVIRRYGKVADVETSEQLIIRCDIRRTVKSIVTGDKVIFRSNVNPSDNGVIEALHPRKTELSRPDFYDGLKVVAANIDQIFIVVATLPEFSLNIIDRYLVACENTGIHPIIVLNKIDLVSADERTEIEALFNYYKKIDVDYLMISCKKEDDLEPLKQLMRDKISILVGPSGVGKSSIVEKLLPNIDDVIDVGAISETSGLGQHTTTSSRLYHLPSGGDLIDSPGIREFGLWHLSSDEILRGFPEFYDYIGNCQFRDCNHISDLNCGLQKAVSEGNIPQWRYDNYLSILKNNDEVKSRTNKKF